MANPIFQQMNQNSILNQFNTFKQNPLGFLSQRGLNIPQQYQNDPKGYIQNMLNSGQMSQQQYNRLMQTARSMGVNLQ